MLTPRSEKKRLTKFWPAIPWKVDWPTKRFIYVGPQIELILGWPPESWCTIEDWMTRIHPLDRDRVVDLCFLKATACIDHEADYSIMTIRGDFVLIRDVVHVARNPAGEIDSLMGFIVAGRSGPAQPWSTVSPRS